MDNVGILSKFEPNNGHEYIPRKVKNDQKHKKIRRIASESTNVPVPKRRRSSSAQGHFKLSTPRGVTK
ncbi:hypothetical protein, partial [Klebsiella pneumoniae]|uniref:hypothetical protein n=1 Tax=Klebsiella pneumoniae TaxID=573 RepID=UPI0030140EDF